MLDVNLLPKNIRAKKQKEIERVKANSPRSAESALGEKITGKTPTVNFFSRFFGKISYKSPLQEKPVSANILQTPPKQTPPAPPPEVTPYPLNPRPISEILTKPVAPKIQTPAIQKGSDKGIVLPDISSIIQTMPTHPQSFSQAVKIPSVPQIKKPVIPPPPLAIKNKESFAISEKIPEESSKDAKKISIGRIVSDEKEKKPEILVMPAPSAPIRQFSLIALSTAGALTIIFAASFVVGSFFVFQRWVSALEVVKNAYQARSESLDKNSLKVNKDVQEASALMQKSQILLRVYQSQEKDNSQSAPK